MSEFVTLESIVELIGKVPESQFIEFKRGQALDEIDKSQIKEEIVRDVSAFANAGGGTIIYGLDEDRSSSPAVACALSAVTNPKADTLRLTSIIRSGMEPVFNAFDVREIPVPAGGKIIVIDIEKAETAHQCKADHKYYHRSGPSRTPMYDHQIRDVMNRRTSPVVRLHTELHTVQRHSNAHVYDLRIALSNEGQRTANLWALDMALPPGLRVEHAGSILVAKPSLAPYPSHRVWEYSCDRGTTNKRAVLLPGQVLLMDSDNGYPQVLLKVTDENYPRIHSERSPLVFRLYVDDCPMQEHTIPFKDWCSF
ncbi:hypothetical protein E4K72_11110 [Oxalobacteraceae bacterium OM1]|nr:hypothetical protein E4K72_11110 [Oxalobacteraceae bacterium OM1]